MATLSRTTIVRFGELLAVWRRTEIETLFYKQQVPDNIAIGSSKLELVMNVLRHFEAEPRPDVIRGLIRAALPSLYGPHQREIERLLIQDGFATDRGQIIDASPDEQAHTHAAHLLIDKYADDLSHGTLVHHLNECNDLFADGKWDSSIVHCRNFVEQILSDIGTAIATSRSEAPNLSRPVSVRDYLQQCGFFGQNERRKLVDGIYGYFSSEGSHPGISTHSAARVSKSMLMAFAF